MIRRFPTPDLLMAGLADFIVETANNAIATRGRFDFAVSGGSSPKRLYDLLTSDGYKNKIDWSKAYFFLGDERNVGLEHPDSNFRMVKQSLFEPLGIAADHVFPVDTILTPAEAAEKYEQLIRQHFNGGPCQFDLVLLGLGSNSHTASLFPHTEVLHEQTKLVSGLFIPEVNMFRITFTAPLINQARHIAFLIYGASKAEAVAEVIQGERNIESHPAQLVQPVGGTLEWFLDDAAAKFVS
ncbi:6-phosphogluconolactonase [Chryseolinea sp. T2]|uniref:6-phosphogluconolactonase n=1 Tax=Chryseolinea sp. T2 TaxID=3129255 RepID=UPI0030780D79